MNVINYFTRLYLIGIVFLQAMMFFGCAPATISDVRTGIGEEYHVLKLPVAQHNIGSEWSKKFGATGKGMLTEDKIKVAKSLKRLDKGTAHQVALGISALSQTGVSGGVGVGGDITNQINLHGLQIVKPVDIGYIAFKPGIAYVTEALRLEGFAIDDNKSVRMQIGVKGSDAPNRSSAGWEAGSASNSGYGGEGLVIGYILQMVDNSTYAKQENGPVELTMNQGRVSIGNANVSAEVSFEKIVAGSGMSLPKNLLWACKKASSKKDSINAAWVLTLKITGDEKKTLKIAFPAHPEIEDCSEYESVVASGINSATEQIERTIVKIAIERSAVNEMLDPMEFGASVTAIKESFALKTIEPGS